MKNGIPKEALVLNFSWPIFIYEFLRWSFLVLIFTSILVIVYVIKPAYVKMLSIKALKIEGQFKVRISKIFAPIAFIFAFMVIYL